MGYLLYKISRGSHGVQQILTPLHDGSTIPMTKNNVPDEISINWGAAPFSHPSINHKNMVLITVKALYQLFFILKNYK